MSAEYNVVVVGAGIIGLSTALALIDRHPHFAIAVVDKESDVASHQTGHNSGIIHSGLYYRPGSLKAELCVRGADRMIEFCQRHGVPFSRNGKIVVATDDTQIDRLAALFERGTANGVRGIAKLGSQELREVEPHVRGVAGIHVPTTGSVDFGEVARTMASILVERGVDIVTPFAVDAIDIDDVDVRVRSGRSTISARGLVNCAGLHADRIARLAGTEPGIRIIPFRGEYYEIRGSSADLVRASIYPVPNPDLPFLGVHLSRSVSGMVTAGPNAVLAGAREGYTWGTIRPRDLWESVSYGGLRKIARRHWRAGVSEVARSLSKRGFTRSVRYLVPGVSPSDLYKAGSGVRAQAVSPEGALIDEFLLAPSRRAMHVLNAPSPGATSSLVIGEYLASEITGQLDLT